MPVHHKTCGKYKVHEAHGYCSGITEEEAAAEEYVMVTVATNTRTSRSVIHAYGPYSEAQAIKEKRDSVRTFKEEYGDKPHWLLMVSVCHMLKPEENNG